MKIRFLFTVLVALIATKGSASQAPLADRIKAIDNLNKSFQVVGEELRKVEVKLKASAFCRERGPRPFDVVWKCYAEADQALLKAIVPALNKYNELIAIQSSLASSTPEQMKVRIQNLTALFISLASIENKLFAARLHALKLKRRAARAASSSGSGSASASSSFPCKDFFDRDRTTTISGHSLPKLDPDAHVCGALRPFIDRMSPVPWRPSRIRVSRGLYGMKISFEGEHISAGESEAPGREDGNCIGRLCGDSERPGHGERGGEGRSGGERSFNRADYRGSEVRDWTAAGAKEEARPYPISDDHIIAIEHENSEKEVHEKFDSIAQEVSAPVQAAWDQLAPVDPRDVYEVESSDEEGDETEEEKERNEIPVQVLNGQAMSVVSRLSQARPQTKTQSDARALGLAAVGAAQKDLAKKRFNEASAMLDLAEGMADIALGVTPGVGWAKDVYEAVTGNNLVTGEKLDTFDRSLAVFGAVSLGIGSKVGTAAKALDKLTDLAKALGHATGSYAAAEKLARSALRIGLKTKEQAKELYEFSRRTLGNEVGSIGDDLSDLIDAFGEKTFGKIWSVGKQRDQLENALEHAKKHLPEFPELQDRVDYIRHARNFIISPPPGTLKKIRRWNGDLLFYHPESNTYASATFEKVPKTMFKFDNGMQDWIDLKGEVVP